MSRLRIALCLALLAATFAAQARDAAAGCPAPAKLDDGWTMAAPKDAGFDPDKLCALDRFISQRTGPAAVNGVVVVRHGKLVMERYYKGIDRPGGGEAVEFGPTIKHGIFSISKSVTSLLIGIARGEGKFPDLDAAVMDQIPARYADLRTPDKARITIRDVLTMSSGLQWNELRPPYIDPTNIAVRMMNAPDPYRVVLQQAVASKPGQTFNYSSGDTELLGLLLANGVGRSIDDYARARLFGPLGIADVGWWKMPGSGQPFAAAGAQLRPRDLAKLGQLLLDDGQWNGKQVVPKGWVAESTTPRLKAFTYLYGYQWWLGRAVSKGRDLPWTAGFGYGGQHLFVQPDSQLVVVVTAGDFASPVNLQGILPIAILEQHVLPAITRD